MGVTKRVTVAFGKNHQSINPTTKASKIMPPPINKGFPPREKLKCGILILFDTCGQFGILKLNFGKFGSLGVSVFGCSITNPKSSAVTSLGSSTL